jgi:hypothetical protein
MYRSYIGYYWVVTRLRSRGSNLRARRSALSAPPIAHSNDSPYHTPSPNQLCLYPGALTKEYHCTREVLQVYLSRLYSIPGSGQSLLPAFVGVQSELEKLVNLQKRTLSTVVHGQVNCVVRWYIRGCMEGQ